MAPLVVHAIRAVRRGMACLLLGMAGVCAAASPWPDAEYSYYADGADLREVLTDFASSFSLALEMDADVQGQVHGRFTASSPTQFLSRLGGVYGFAWHSHAGTLFISKASNNTMRAILLPDGASNLKGVLVELGVLEPRFGWAEVPGQRVVMVTGPPSYLKLVDATLKALPGSASRQEVRVFRLRFASAEDRVINYRGSGSVQPGLASVLRQLIGGRAAVSSGLQGPPLDPAVAAASPLPTLPGNVGAPGGVAAAADPAASSAMGMRSPPADRGPTLQVQADPRFQVPSIQSDPRLNAIIVQDQPERMPVYERLIAQLDLPSSLIEIEAMVVDVNSERASELGINWSLGSGGTGLSFGVPGSLSGPGTLSLTRGGASTLVGNGALQLLTQLRLLENHGDARIQSRPSVLTMDNVEAVLDLSETFYARIQGERVASVSPITAGITLRVTPRLIEGPHPAIQLKIDIEDGQLQDRQVDALPTVRRSSVSTQAIVSQGESLLIAGYATDHDVEAIQKVPGLGDLPGIGALFSNKVRTLQKRERLFLIRPKLVGTPFLAGGRQP